MPTAPGVHLTPAAALRELGLESVFLTDLSPAYDASFWTLGVEMRWYLLFPLLLELYVRSRMGFYLVGGLCYALYFLTPWSVADEGTLPCFMLGIVAADLHLAESPLRRFAPVVAVVTLAAAALWQSRVDWVDHGNPLWHAAAFSLVVASGSGLFARALRWKALAFTGVASYSIYLIHQPVLDALAAGTFFFVGTTTGHYFALPFPDDCSPTNTLSDFWTECDAYEGSICTDTVLKQVTCTVTVPSTSCFAPAAESAASQVVCAGSPNGGGIAQ